MRKSFASLILVIILIVLATAPAYAGGDKVRGDGGQGTVHQVQIQDPPPFQP